MFNLHPAQPDDLPFIRELERGVMSAHAIALWGRYLPPDTSAFDLRNTRIVTLGQARAGYVTTERSEDHLRLRKLYLVPGQQGLGLGRRLLAQIRDEARAEGLPLRLSVLRPNTRALAFYRREGMEPLFETAERIFLTFPPDDRRNPVADAASQRPQPAA